MWDFRSRPQKWKRKMARHAAAKRGEEWIEPDRIPALSWTVHVPYDLWMQQKDRVRFKGAGKHNAFDFRKDDMIRAMGRFLIAESQVWRKPGGMDSEDWTERKTFEEAMEWVVAPRKSIPKEKIKIKGHLLSIIGGRLLDALWLAEHIDHCKRQAELHRLETLQREESALNDPDPGGRKAGFNKMYVGLG